MLGTVWAPIETLSDHLQNSWYVFIAIGFVIGFSRRFIKNLSKQSLERLELMIDKKVEPIIKEITPNGGGSMKDALKRLESGQEHISDKVSAVGEKVDYATDIATENAGRLATVTANLMAAYYEMDALGNVVQVNDSYLELYEITEAEALGGAEWRRHISPEDLSIIDATGNQAIVNERDWYCSFTVIREGIHIPVVAVAKALFKDSVFSGYSGAMRYDRTLLKEPNDLEKLKPKVTDLATSRATTMQMLLRTRLSHL